MSSCEHHTLITRRTKLIEFSPWQEFRANLMLINAPSPNFVLWFFFKNYGGFLKKNQNTKFGLRALISIKLALNSRQGENLISYVRLVSSVGCLQLDIQLTAPWGFLKKNQNTKFGLRALISIKLALNSCQGENLIHYVLLVFSVCCLQLDIQLVPRGFLKIKSK